MGQFPQDGENWSKCGIVFIFWSSVVTKQFDFFKLSQMFWRDLACWSPNSGFFLGLTPVFGHFGLVSLPNYKILDCYQPGWHNLWGYQWSQQILKSYPKTGNHKFLRQKCSKCVLSQQNDVFYVYDKMSWYVMICHDLSTCINIYPVISWHVIICHDMSWCVWQKCR